MVSLMHLEMEDSSSYTPREYQVELFRRAQKENIIVYLPTGSGKTFIAALLIQENRYETTKPLNNGGRRTIFLVPTVVLAQQQADYLGRHTCMTVKAFYGSMGVDYWKGDRWAQEFESNQVLVMTAQVFVDILNHAFFSMRKVNLLVIDECHAAVKDAPMKQVLTKLDQCDASTQPRILGLTAALFRRRLKPRMVMKMIRELSETMKSTICLPSNISVALSNSTKPCEVFCAYSDENLHECESARHLASKISQLVKDLAKDFGTRYKNNEKVAAVLLDPLNDVSFLLETFGIFGAFHGSAVYMKLIEKMKIRPHAASFRKDLERLSSGLLNIRRLCKEQFDNSSEHSNLNRWLTPRVLRLFELLSRFDPTQKDTGRFMCIVFVERRSSANVLYHLIKEASKNDERMRFIRPQFTMGQASKGNVFKESDILGMKQREIMKQFREGQCNLLVATSVLEEGIDIPACNVIIRFDPLKTYCEYVQSKGRARSRQAYYIMMTSEKSMPEHLDMIAEFHGIEQMLLEGQYEEEETDIDVRCRNLFPPYMPFGCNGPRITMVGAVSLVNRYCSVLSTDPTPLVPQWTEEETPLDQVDPDWLDVINTEIKPDSPFEKFYRFRLLLPLNSPLRDEMVGPFLPSKRSAKRAVALEACQKLHKLQELDDAHLLPVTQVDQIEDELLDEELNATGARSGTSKRKQCYPKKLAKSLVNCLPQPGEICFVYVLNFEIINCCNDDKKFYYPNGIENQMAILTSNCMPNVCSFPLVTRAGEIDVKVDGVDSIILSAAQLDKLKRFHRFLIEDVILLFKTREEFDFEDPSLGLVIVPLKKNDLSIDFDLVDRINSTPSIDWEARPDQGERPFHYDPARYVDAVLTPWYTDPNQRTTYYVDAVTRMTPLSAFPDEKYTNYANYYQSKYQLTVTNVKQELLEVSREITGRNYLLPRNISKKDDDPLHMIPEFCTVHALAASLWKQIVWIPCVLERLNHLLVAEEFRIRFASDTGVGVEFVPRNCFWPSLREHISKDGNEQLINDPAIREIGPPIRADMDMAEAVSQPVFSSKRKYCDLASDIDENIWNLDLSSDEFYCSLLDAFENNVEMVDEASNFFSIGHENNGEKEVNVLVPLRCSTPNPTNWNKSFDNWHSSQWGPGPGVILEALTMTKAHEGFDMERMETIGDSLLKLVISIFVYGQSTGSRKCTEGTLSVLRMRQISNRNLYRLGKKADLGSAIVAEAFDLKTNFLPPCVSLIGEHNNKRVNQMVSDKNIADSVEALTGAYLLASGVAGAMKFLKWIGLSTIPDGLENNVNPVNGFPRLAACFRLPSPENGEEMLNHLYSGLEQLEAKINYTFKDKTLLIEALSHPSYFPNRLTVSYQRLEFLGDAVLDYLVTRFYFDDERKYSPAGLTDLRSATVNNATFAVLAVRNGFHNFLKHMSPTLEFSLDKFIRIQIDNKHQILDDYFLLDNDDTVGAEMACDVEVPKVLGDIFESVAGAIFADSGMSLDAVWKSYYPFLHQEMDNFRCNIPKSPIRLLHEKYPGIVFKKNMDLPDGRICVVVEIEGKSYKGVGFNSKTAKCAAAKYALRDFSTAE